MKKLWLTLILMGFIVSVGFSQIKRQFEDKKQNGRTVVVKEQGITDQQILQQQFGDVRPGKVIRITMDKPPRTRTPKPKVIRTCLLYTSPSPRDATLSRMPSSA